MNIIYEDTKKDLPREQLHRLFVSAGWSDGTETPEMVEKGYGIPWLNSSLVVFGMGKRQACRSSTRFKRHYVPFGDL